MLTLLGAMMSESPTKINSGWELKFEFKIKPK
jgi:hypothetical protein